MFHFFNFTVFSEPMKKKNKKKNIISPPLFVKLILPSCLFIQCNALIIQQQRFWYVSLKEMLIYINAVELNILVDFLAHSFRFQNSLRKSCSKSTPNVFCCDRTSKKLIITQTQTMFWKTEILSQTKKMSQCQAKFEKKKFSEVSICIKMFLVISLSKYGVQVSIKTIACCNGQVLLITLSVQTILLL